MQHDHPARLIFLTNRVGRQFARLLLDGMTYEGFQPLGTHAGLLADLIEEDGQRQQDLAISGIKDKATIARSLAQLEEAGMVVRRTGEIDRRAKRIFLTDKGRNMWAHLTGRVVPLMEDVTADIDHRKLQNCLSVLADLYDSLPAKLLTPATEDNE